MYFFRLENVLETTSHCIYSFSSSLIFVKTTCLSEVFVVLIPTVQFR